MKKRKSTKKTPLFQDLLEPGVNEPIIKTLQKGKQSSDKKKFSTAADWDSAVNNFFK
jgi:hypothetical protein